MWRKRATLEEEEEAYLCHPWGRLPAFPVLVLRIAPLNPFSTLNTEAGRSISWVPDYRDSSQPFRAGGGGLLCRGGSGVHVLGPWDKAELES